MALLLSRYFPDSEIALHLGAHRTGTTTLQAQLDNAQLPTRSMMALTPPRDGKRTEYTLRNAFADFRKLRRQPFCPTVWLRLRRSLRGMVTATAPKKLIISDESFLGPIFDRYGDGIYPQAAEWLQDSAVFLGPNVSQIHLVIRPYEEFLTSAYAMRAVFAQGVGGIDQYINGFLRCRRGWPQIVEDIRYAFPTQDLRLWSFPAQLENDGLFKALTQVDAPPPKLPALNSTTSQEGVDYALANKKDPDYNPDSISMRFSEGTKVAVFTEQEAQLLHEKYLLDLAILSKGSIVKNGDITNGLSV